MITTAGAMAIAGLILAEVVSLLGMAISSERAQREQLEATNRMLPAGVALGEVIVIDESGAAPPIPLMKYRAEAMVASGGAPVTPGELEISATVSVTFAIR